MMTTGVLALGAIAACMASGDAQTAQPKDADRALTPFRDVTNEVFFKPLTAGRSMDAEIVDVTGDGIADILVAGEFGPNTLLRGTDGKDGQDRYEVVRHAFGTAINDSEDIAVADFNRDGRMDVVFVSEDTPTDELHLGADGGFTDASDRLNAGLKANAVLAADIDGDGDADLIIAGSGDGLAAQVVLLNNGDATFTKAEDLIPNADVTTQDMELGDIDGDGDADLVIANENGNQLLINDGTGTFTDESAERLPLEDANEETREADLADVDGDGDLDLFFANVGWNPQRDPVNRLLINDGTGRFTDETDDRLPTTGAYTTLDADFADLDGDGDHDLVLGNVNGAPVQVWQNDGKGMFTDRTAALIPKVILLAVIDIEVFDLTGDGRLDIYACNHQGGDIVFSPG